MKPLASALLVLVTACGSAPVWTHATKDLEDYKKDLVDCERFFGVSERETEGCMTRKGWRRDRR